MCIEHYHLLVPIARSRAKFRFSGPFLGRTVIWNTELLTFDAEQKSLRLECKPLPRRSFRSIEVGPPSTEGIALRVVLDVDEITAPVIQKTIVMIRNYKLLAPGYHEFGHTE